MERDYIFISRTFSHFSIYVLSFIFITFHVIIFTRLYYTKYFLYLFLEKYFISLLDLFLLNTDIDRF